MYIGRIVAVAKTTECKAAALYRVSSRSFPNREAVVNDDKIAIIPKAGHENDLRINPYIAYNCVRPAGKYMIASNGSHTDPIAEKIAMNMPVRDAITMGLLAMDYEKDHLDTPRIVAVISNDGEEAYLGIIRKDAVLVRKFDLNPGELFYVSTYEKNVPQDENIDTAFTALTAEAACDFVKDGGVFGDFTNPVTAACAVVGENGFEFAVKSL